MEPARVADLRGFIAGGAEGEGAGKFRHHLHPALLAVFLFEDVLLSGGDDLNPRKSYQKPCL